MLRTAAVAVLSGTLLALAAFPAAAATSTGHTFSIPGVNGISAWGSYERTGASVRVSICLKDTVRGVYGGAAAGIAYDGPHRQVTTAVVVGFQHVGCQTMTSRYTSHLVVDAVSGWPDGKVRQVGHVKQVY